MVTTDVAVVGGSVGGLCAAIALRAVGCTTTIHEQAAQALQGRGAGIVLHGDLAAFLERQDVVARDRIAVRSARRVVLDRAGHVEVADETARWTTSYDKLMAGLLASLGAAAYRTSRAVTSVSDDGRTLSVDGADPVEADLVVAADGAGSVVRRQLLPDVAPSYSGYVAWRGLVGEKDLPPRVAETLAGDFAFFTDPQPAPFPTQILSYLVPGPDGSLEPGERALNWVWYQPVAALSDHLTDGDGHVHEWSLPADALTDASASRRRALARDRLPPVFAELVEATCAPSIQAVTDLASPRCVFGRAVVLGDAAFVPRPHTAYGSAKSAMDADALATAVHEHPGDVDAALAAWEPGQLRRGREVIDEGQRLGADFGLGADVASAPA